jgi:NADPH2:quinone reductase
MRAQQVEVLEGPDGLRLVDIPEPEGADQVLIDVAAAGVAFPDLLLSRGQYQLKPPLPFVPGVEVAGIVRGAPWFSAGSPTSRPRHRPQPGTFLTSLTSTRRPGSS